MKKYVATAAALMLGTSALAWAPAEKAHMGAMQAGTAISEVSAGKMPLALAALDDKGAMKAETAAYDSAADWTASGDGKKTLASLDDSLVETAAAEGMKDADANAGKPAVETASLDGKPEAATAAESGVAMGGPLEPVADGAKETPSASDDHATMDHGTMPVDATAANKPEAPAEMAADAEAMTATKPAATEAPATPGVGGPIEARTDYPPCRPGPGDDRCIQLYERGVTSRKD